MLNFDATNFLLGFWLYLHCIFAIFLNLFITHNVHHAYPVGDAFTILKRGTSFGTFCKTEVSREDVLGMMAGGDEMENLTAELEEFARIDAFQEKEIESPTDNNSNSAGYIKSNPNSSFATL